MGGVRGEQGRPVLGVVGRVTAGLPLYAQQEWDGSIVVDAAVFRGQNLFARRVKGDSMKDAGILDGDLEGEYRESTYYKMPERQVGNLGERQAAYFRDVLERNRDVRWTFVLMHKPLWMREGHGNLAPLEEALEGRDYTVIGGHFHTFSHHKRNSMDYLILGTTGGSQNPEDPNSFDHITLVHMAGEPEINHLKMDGVLDITGTAGGAVPENQ